MDRRKFIKTAIIAVSAPTVSPTVSIAARALASPPDGIKNELSDDCVKDYLVKMKNFDMPHKDDIYFDNAEYIIMTSLVRRLKRLHRTVGYANFHIMSLDRSIKVAANYPYVGSFKKPELNLMEQMFYQDPSAYGFFGDKPVKNLTATIKKRDVKKIPGTGHYLYNGEPSSNYTEIIKKVGKNAILTSGVRGVLKQFYLFANKIYRCKGNISQASRSLAPPGYSFHGIGDFDIGQRGYGIANFTSRFTETSVFQRLRDLGYLKLRYPQNNMLGVRFEPWHIKVAELPKHKINHTWPEVLS